MPSKKRFEYIKLTVPFGTDHMDMYEMAEHHLALIKQLFDEIEKDQKEGYTAVVEVPDDNTVYAIYRNNHDKFIIVDQSKKEQSVFTPIGFYNWCFEKAPFISMVGVGKN